MSGDTRSVVVRLSMEASNYIANAQKAGTVGEDAMQRVERSASAADRSIDKIGATAGKVALGGIAALLATGKAAVDWESQWAGVTKTVDGTTEQMAELEEGLRGLATSLPATHEEIAGVAEAAGQLGVAREDIIDFTKTMVDLGETTNLTAEEAATSIAQISNVMGTAGDEVDNFGAALVALGNDGASTEKQILDMTQRIAGAGAQIGLTEPDILAIANAAASMGIEAEAGGSAISRVFTDLAKATSQGGDKLETFAEVAGLSAGEFARAFEEDPARAFASFTQGLDRINKSGGDVFTVLDQLKLSDVRVSQALLGMAASGDLLTDSLDLGAEAWTENTALAIEAAKRYDTTASEVKVSWNKIKDAGIDAGDSLLPVASEIADKVGAVADAFGKLPAPVQGAFTELLGIGTLTAGALWLGASVVRKVSDTREAIDLLGTSSPRTTKAMKGLAAAGAGLAVLTVAASAIRAVQEATDESVPGVETLTGRLIDLSSTPDGFSFSLGAEFDSLGDSIDRITDKTADEKFGDALQTPFEGFVGEAGTLRRARAEIEALDQSLASLASTGNADVAADALDNLATQYGLTEEQTKGLLSQLPLYDEALAGIANQAELAGDAQTELGAGALSAANGITYSAEEIKAASDAYDDARDAARDTATAFFGVGDSVNDAKVSLADWTQELNDQARALENFTANSLKAAKKGLDDGLIASLQAAGPEGARRMRELANATDEEIDKANNAWKRGQKAIEKYIAATTDVPPELVTVVSVESAEAINRMRIVQQQLDSIDRFIPVNIHVSRTGAGGDIPYVSGGTGTRKAGGGLIHGPGTGTSDEVPIWASNKEYVVKAAAVEKYGVHMFDSLNAMRFAGGGQVGNKPKRGYDPGGPEETDAERERRERREAVAEARERDRQEQEDIRARGEEARANRLAEMQEAIIAGQEKAAQQLIDAAQAQLSAAEGVAESWAQAMQRAGQGATAGFKTSLFGGSQRSGLWTGSGGGSGSGWLDALTNDINGLEERQGLIAQLSGAGLTGSALEALLTQGSNADITDLINSGQVGTYASLYARRESLDGTVAGAAGQAAYGMEYAAAMAAVGSLGAQVLYLSQELAAISAQRPLTINEAVNAQATLAEFLRLQSMAGAG